MTTDNKNTRRQFLKASALGLGALVSTKAISAAPPAPALPPRPTKSLDPKDPMAMALGFVTDRSKADSKKFPQLNTPDGKTANCKNCMLFHNSQAGLGQCTIFAAGLVPENGWCMSWVKKV